ncbi:MAG TPA: GNAT family N-acetyltransferase [Thermoanaerobaculia bacterium]|nr:GNAT family N-acetyltransferase [Thermoanaerobaculia bacterium]
MSRETAPADPSEIRIGHGFRDGLIGRVVELHALYYAPTWGFGLPMEIAMAQGLAELAGRYDPERDRILWSEVAGRVVGSITVDGQDACERGARIRWFILDTGLHGRGIGGRLVEAALAFCRQRGYPRVHLHTLEGLRAAVTLYRRAGFAERGTTRMALWETELDVLEMELDLQREAERRPR